MKIVEAMDYEDMISCYSIIKKEQCVSYLKDDILHIINEKVISKVRKSLDLPYDDNIYFDLRHVKGRTYKAGIRLNIKTEHVIYNNLHTPHYNNYNFDSLKGFPKIVFSKNILNIEELIIPKNKINSLKDLYNSMVKYKEKILKYEELLSEFEGEKYKVRVKNTLHTVLVKTENNDFEVLFDMRPINNFNINNLIQEVNTATTEIKSKKFLNTMLASREYNSFILYLKQYSEFNINVDINNYINYYKNGLQFKLYIGKKCVFNEELKIEFDDFIKKIDNCKLIIQDFITSYSIVIKLVNLLNSCKNNFWNAQFMFDHNEYPAIKVDQKYFIPKKHLTFEIIRFEDLSLLNENDIIALLKTGMCNVLRNMERCGYRVMEVKPNEK